MMMKNIFKIFLWISVAVILFSCDEEEENFTWRSGDELLIYGPEEVIPGEEVEYSVAGYDINKTYNWTVTGPATVQGDTEGEFLRLTFNSVGTVTVAVDNGANQGDLEIAVDEATPAVVAELAGTGVLRSGETETIILDFSTPLANTPNVAFDTDGFMSGALGPVTEVDESTYELTYTAGAGNGTPRIVVSDVVSTADYGSVEMEDDTVNIFRVDNTPPVADLSYSQNRVNDGTEVTITAQFSEPVTFEDPANSALYISFSGGGVPVESDSLNPTDDPLVYTYTYTVNSTGDGTIDIDLENVVDYAGNPLATVNNDTELEVDNTAPNPVVASASDEGDYATISLTSLESGAGWYLVMADGATPPADSEEVVAGGGVSSGLMELSGGTPETTSIALATGDYNVYFVARDEAGNYSDIEMINLYMD